MAKLNTEKFSFDGSNNVTYRKQSKTFRIMDITINRVEHPNSEYDYLIYADRHYIGNYKNGKIKWSKFNPVLLTLKDLQNIVIELEKL